MKQINLREAKAKLSSIIDSVEQTGEHVIVTRHGKPAAGLVPVEALYKAEKEPIDNRAFIEHLLKFPGPLEIDRKTGDFRELIFD